MFYSTALMDLPSHGGLVGLLHLHGKLYLDVVMMLHTVLPKRTGVILILQETKVFQTPGPAGSCTFTMVLGQDSSGEKMIISM